MSENGHLRAAAPGGPVLRWLGRVVSAEELGRSLNGHREILLSAHAIITPLAAEELRARGVRVSREAVEKETRNVARWGLAQERQHPYVTSAMQSLEREGVSFVKLQADRATSAAPWARTVAECVSRGECKGGVVFCDDSSLVCCVANKLPGLRAAAAANSSEAARATSTLGANLVAVQMPGRTFFEIRQILQTLCRIGEPACPANVAHTLQELDGHAHR